MSRSKRRSDNTAPALFPFLAVLLCTIGALVLILVLTVTNSHASARRDAEMAMVEVKDAADIVDVVSEELIAQREDLKELVERRRRDLANIEDHIARLKNNLQQLLEKIERIQSDVSKTETSQSDKSAQVAELRKEIDDKKRELLEEIAKQKKRKPAFAVIPYVGTNGTSRRPVYMECTKEGVIVQPEGLLISLNELKPPHGPGNPMDAALRVLRLAYQQRDTTFGINQPPYPLLLVRPDGIHTYALAREAMSGWDDQFGYELINADMDLKFPAGVPGLKEQLADTIETAKRRQQALIAAMPRSRLMVERDDSWDSIDSAYSTQGAGTNRSAVAGGTGTGLSGDGPSGFADGSGATQEWKLVQGMANSQVSGAIQKNSFESENPSAATQPNRFGNAPSPLGFPSSTIENGNSITGEFVADGGLGQGGGMISKGRATEANSIANEKLTAAGRDGVNTSASNNAASSSRANGSGQPNGSGQANDGGQANGSGQAQSDFQQGGAGSSAMGSKSPSGNNAPPLQGANAFSSGSATGNSSNPMQPPNGSFEQPRTDASSQPNASFSVDKNISNEKSPTSKAKHVNPDGDLKPISVSAGRGWAASRAEGKATPVTRPINVVVLKDRWLLRSDVAQNSFDASVTMDDGPQQAGNQIAAAIRKRVDSWGLSLPGGYWSPTLTIEAASDAQQSIARLERLLEGSGVEIKVVPLKLPNRR